MIQLDGANSKPTNLDTYPEIYYLRMITVNVIYAAPAATNHH